jgi:hypothetical protein
MLLPTAERTWIVMFHGHDASIYESDELGGCPTRVHSFSANAGNSHAPATAFVDRAHWVGKLAQTLESARASNAYDRLLLVGPEPRLTELRVGLSEQTRALIASEHIDDLTEVSREDLRWHMPERSAFL